MDEDANTLFRLLCDGAGIIKRRFNKKKQAMLFSENHEWCM
jgi:hypothetical protein